MGSISLIYSLILSTHLTTQSRAAVSHILHYMFCVGQYTNLVLIQTSNHNLNKSSRIVLGDKALFGFKKSRRRAKEEDDSEYKIEEEKAREALRKLDQQIQSLSAKQVTTPKIRAGDAKQWSLKEREELSGSFLSYAASLLLLLTILYNVFFLTVIKPAIDGPETPQYADNYNINTGPPTPELLVEPSSYVY